jgi:hypothetical protein
MLTKVRCSVGKHEWRTRGRGNALTYICQVCGKTRDKPPASKKNLAPASAAWFIPAHVSNPVGPFAGASTGTVADIPL